MAQRTRAASRAARHTRVRAKVRGSARRPRLAVFRSLTHISAQLIDDDARTTLASASDVGAKELSGVKGRSERAKAVGKLLAERASAKGIGEVVLDRGGYRYHGRVKALADAAREGGLRI